MSTVARSTQPGVRSTPPTIPDCYKCEHRRSIPGNHHSACGHPDAHPIAAVYAQAGRHEWTGTRIVRFPTPLSVMADAHGYANGWAMWPLNFDPIWIMNCNGFAPKP